MLSELIFFAGISGITVFLGGLLANQFYGHVSESFKKQQFVHGMVAFGAGIILSAVALVLIPKGLEELNLLPICIAFILGTLSFYILDQYLAKKGGKTATLLAMMMDFIPESIALGATYATHRETAILLSIFIGLQNLPEAFNAFEDLKKSGFQKNLILKIFFLLSFCGIIGALIGSYTLTDKPQITALLMVFASGGILYLLFQDIIPESKLKNSYVTSLGASLGFLIGIIGEKAI